MTPTPDPGRGDSPRPDEGDTGEKRTVAERIARATWDFAYAEDPLPPPWPEEGEEHDTAMAVADAVLDALGLERVGIVDGRGVLWQSRTHDEPSGLASSVTIYALYPPSASGRSDDRD